MARHGMAWQVVAWDGMARYAMAGRGTARRAGRSGLRASSTGGALHLLRPMCHDRPRAGYSNHHTRAGLSNGTNTTASCHSAATAHQRQSPLEPAPEGWA